MSQKGQKTTTYSLEWDKIVELETKLINRYTLFKSKNEAQALLIVSIGCRLGLRVIDNLGLKWGDLSSLRPGDRFIRIERKTGKERILIMSTKLFQVVQLVNKIQKPKSNDYIFTSQKGKGAEHMSIQNFNRLLKRILNEYGIRYIGNCSSHLLRKSWVVGAIKKGFDNGDHLSLIKVSRLVGHSNVSTTLRYTNFETSSALGLFELD